MLDFKAIIDRWPSMAEFASDLGLKYAHATQMKWRNSVPPTYWRAMVAGAEKRGIEGVTMGVLAELAASTASARSQVAAE